MKLEYFTIKTGGNKIEHLLISSSQFDSLFKGIDVNGALEIGGTLFNRFLSY